MNDDMNKIIGFPLKFYDFDIVWTKIYNFWWWIMVGWLDKKREDLGWREIEFRIKKYKMKYLWEIKTTSKAESWENSPVMTQMKNTTLWITKIKETNKTDYYGIKSSFIRYAQLETYFRLVKTT